jgi:serine/threonine-protein kinase
LTGRGGGEVAVIELQAGQQFGGYRVLGVLGSGASGQVLRAHDPVRGRDVALKVLHPRWSQDEGYPARFLREVARAARLDEPHLIPVHDHGEVDGRLYLAMQLVEGEDLASLLDRSGPLDAARAVDLVGQVARALDAAHAVGLVHGGVTPSSVLLAGRGDGGDVAGSAAGADVARLVGLGVAPTADASPDARDDVQALAGLLFELLTGRPPATASGAAPSWLRPGIPAELDGVVLRGLAADRDERWTSAGGMAAAARAVLALSGIEVARPAEQPAAAGSPQSAGPAGTAAGRGAGRRPFVLAAVPALAAVLVGVRAWWGARRARRSGR